MSALVGTLQNAWKMSDLRTKIIYTLMMFLVFRIGAHIPVPGINRDAIAQLINSGALFGFFDVISGGSFRNFSVFAMSITPYINASIILQLLTVVVPRLEQLAKEGNEGRKKITEYTRYFTIILAFIQAIGLSYGLSASGVIQNPSWGNYLLIATTLTAGTAFLMWIGERITENGIGNGISLIIFAGIVSRLPQGINTLYQYMINGTVNVLGALAFIIIAGISIAGIIYINEGQRRIPVQYAKRVVGRRVYGGQNTHIPLRVNMAGVIPVIFASSLLAFPSTIAQFFPNSGIASFFNQYFQFGSFLHSTFYAVLILFFTYFYTAITFNPVEVADNMKKYGGFIPGMRPGRPTSEYLTKVMSRLTLVGGIFLTVISLLPTFIIMITGITNIYFGGTALLIVVGVALDTMKQLEANMLNRHYQGFMK
ncbi:preprotein translocase subunit SecY [Heliophilum fasciatum]|uniref:Protein translocase subunit SecY n=1 Tax=Heliophilum fasciatum TaxID=35700 RepID=A0A4R2RLB2_9FIRM|nr:preprotein translocase subunit SecY [Heliophilum fasciatum]MCW2277796.1 preprotein translocase subunit SecY [Heliophilum fasciatum]TCP64710.1 protein translocase subunit secY/sec61 alpha [Heliophilum fasciatum]